MPTINTEEHLNAEGLANLWERISTTFARKTFVTRSYLNKLTPDEQTVASPVIFNRNITAASFNATSARELKENIALYEDSALDLINSVDVVSFNFKDDETKQRKVGFIADDTDELLATPAHDKMDLYNCVGVLLKAVQELSAENKELKKKIEDLEK